MVEEIKAKVHNDRGTEGQSMQGPDKEGIL